MSNKTKWIFGISGLGKDMMFAMSTIMSLYLINYVGMSAAFVGLMFMVVRLWDAINDPIMGAIVDNTKGKWGKFRPWILIGTILNAIILVFVFFNPGFKGDSIGLMIWVTVFYTLWGMSYTLMDIPFWSMIPALTDVQKERESVTAITRFFTSIGYFVISAPPLVLAAFLGAGVFDPEGVAKSAMRSGFLYMAIGVSIIFVISQVIMVTNVKEKISAPNTEKITLKGMFGLLKENDQLLVVMLVVVITNFTLYITSTMAFYYIAYDIGDEGLYLPFIAAGGVVQLLGVAGYKFMSDRFNRKQIYNISIMIQVFAFVGLFINAFILGNSILLMFVFGVPVFFGQGLGMVLTTVFLTDTVEYGELKTGKRSEAIVFSVQTFVVKLATGLSMGIVGVGLALFQFKSDADAEELLDQTNTTIWGIRLMMFILPILGMMFARYIFNKKHILNEEKYLEICEELRIKRGEASEERV